MKIISFPGDEDYISLEEILSDPLLKQILFGIQAEGERFLTPGNKGQDCLYNGKHCDPNGTPLLVCCDECDYQICCFDPDMCNECFAENNGCEINACRLA